MGRGLGPVQKIVLDEINKAGVEGLAFGRLVENVARRWWYRGRPVGVVTEEMYSSVRRAIRTLEDRGEKIGTRFEE